MEKKFIIASALALSMYSATTYDQLTEGTIESTIESLSVMTHEQALIMKGKKFTSGIGEQCEASTFDPKKLGSVEHISCYPKSLDNYEIRYSAIFGNVEINTNKILFLQLATARGEVFSDPMNEALGRKKNDFVFSIGRELVLARGENTYFNINNCKDKVIIASVAINPSAKSKPNPFYEKIIGNTLVLV